ncbi:MAG: glycoside hydrolase family 3 C-terminal domain-containing protein [Micropruina sp.]|nr:glycoside hydrolase family 3 C-terminal domain-containing protein [Micropruina sp.]
MTDWFARHTQPAGVLSGLDVQMPRPTAELIAALDTNAVAGVDDGDTPAPQIMAAVDRAVTAVLTAMDQVGLIGTEGHPLSERATTANAAIARRVATQGAVLLQNNTRALPLTSADLADLAVVGPTAKSPLIGGGGSARVNPDAGAVQSTLDVLTARGADVTWATGEELDGVLIPAEALTQGTPIDGTYGTGQTVTVKAPTAGDYTFALQTTGSGGQLLLSTATGPVVASTQSRFGAAGGSLIPASDGRTNDTYLVTLAAGQEITLVVIPAAGQSVPMRLQWVTPELRAQRIAEAAQAAANAEVAIVFGYNEGTEGEDRASLSLPGHQNDVIAAVAAANPNTVVVLNTGDPVAMPWKDDVKAILQLWYPGQEGAEATVDLLTGVVNPSGKLPETYPADQDATPVSDPANYPGTDTTGDGVPDTQEYTEGSDIGYRWYEATGTKPLFAFGHGLSYTTFKYTGLSVQRAGDELQVSFTLRNSGRVSGTEVPQVYLGRGTASATPTIQLAAFDRVTLRPGEARRVTLRVHERQLSVWDADADAWARAVGTRPVLVGGAVDSIQLTGKARIR